MKEQEPHSMKRQLMALLVFALVLGVVFYFYPQKALPTINSAWHSLTQFLFLLPTLIFLLGYFTVAIKPDTVKKNFGKGSGFTGSIKALIFGSLMSTGPFYMAFPIARSLKEKGAKISDIVIFLSAWNGITMIAEVLEFHFMGPVFMIVRGTLTVCGTFIIGYTAGYISSAWEKRH